jgi:hypothetical protein
MRFKDSQQPLPEIARALNVDAVIEGSVLRDGRRVRITAQLIDARTDKASLGQQLRPRCEGRTCSAGRRRAGDRAGSPFHADQKEETRLAQDAKR